MFSKKMTKKSMNACSAQINRLKEKLEKADAVIVQGRCRSFDLCRIHLFRRTFNRYFQTLLLNMAFPICTPAAFIRLKP